MPNPFDESLRAMDRAHALSRSYVSSLPSRPVAQRVTPDALRAALDEPLPEKPSDPASALEEWLRRAEPGIVATSGPRFFGWVVGGSTPAALAGDWLASALDQFGGLWAGSPAQAETELVVLRWLKELFGLPAGWAGALTSGATLANLIGLGAGRQWAAARLGFDASEDGLVGEPIAVVASETVHASALKALGTLGLGRPKDRVPARGGRMDVAAARARLASESGPVLLLAGAGEVNTGAFDDLEALASLRDSHAPGCWLHVDAAFGLFAGASPRLRPLLRGIERADSVAVDGHKWLNVPYDCGFAFVRDESALRGAFAASAPYVAGSGGYDADDYGPEMSRRFRALAAWCALKAYGHEGYRALVERCVAHAAELARFVKATDGLELLDEPTLNIVLFHASSGDEATRALVKSIQAGGEAFVTGTVWGGKAAVRAAFDNWSTSEEDVRVLEKALSDALKASV